MDEIVLKLEKFLASKQRNAWIQDDSMSVYVRKATRYINSVLLKTLDIATVEVDEDKRNQGHWTRFLAAAHEINPYQGTFIECVHNPILSESLIRHGWLIIVDGPSFYMRKQNHERASGQ